MSFSPRAALVAIVFMLGAPGFAQAAAGAQTSALPTHTLDRCSWDHPGVNPFMGDVVAAVDRYRDIPPAVRERLKARMARRDYEDIVSIRRDSITGDKKGRDYGATISEMHFGTDRLCHSVTRAAWSPTMQERGLVYCESGQCILVPTVCRNVSRISRREVGPDHAEALPAALELGDASAGGDSSVLDQAPSFAAPIGAGPMGLGAALAGGPRSDASAAPGFVGLGAAGWGGAGGHAGGRASSVPLASPDTGDAPPVTPVTPVPEPQTWALMGVGLVALGLLKRRRDAMAAR